MARVRLLASRVEQRAVIRFFWAKGLSTAEIHNEMQPVYGHKCFNLSVVKSWCRKFSNGRTSLVDNKRSGRHLAATDNDVVKKIDQFIRISDIVLYTGISRGSVHTVVHDHLKFHKVFEAYRNHFLFTLC